ncbi:MAG TPA: NUDIX domain-containing protein [Phnomibacter sp.]|nr:NUDIX domain-containing protein [Phnomibacter sp.]
MDNRYCIYFGEKPFIITNCLNPQLYALTTQGGTILINQPTPAAIRSTVSDLDKTEAEAAIILTNQVPVFWQHFSDLFQTIVAGGGLVANEKGEYLFIYRKGKWDLPKGKLDPNETIADCAIREVQEETGLQQVSLGEALGSTWHVYHERGAFILKESVWFTMKAHSTAALTPQTAEDIHDIKWIAPADFAKVISNTYPSVIDVLQRIKPH